MNSTDQAALPLLSYSVCDWSCTPEERMTNYQGRPACPECYSTQLRKGLAGKSLKEENHG